MVDAINANLTSYDHLINETAITIILAGAHYTEIFTH